MMKTVGVILAGGESTRFGEDKSLYSLAGKEMYQHVADMFKDLGVCDDIIVSTNQRLKNDFALKTIVDVSEGLGPLGGLYAVSQAYPDARLIVNACDTPYVSSDWMNKLLEYAKLYPNHIVISSDGEIIHPMIGIYQGKGLADKLARQIESGRLSMRAFFDNQKVIEVNASEFNVEKHIFQNINYKSDIEEGQHGRSS